MQRQPIEPEKTFNLVSHLGCLNCIKFKCNKSGRIYTIVQSSFGSKGILNTIDTLVRDDDERISVERKRLVKRFNDIEPIKLFYEKQTSKPSKVKRRK